MRRFAGVRHKGGRGVQNYFGAVRDGSFPNAGVKGYEDGGEWKTFLEQMGDERWHSAADLDAIAGEPGRVADNSGPGVVSFGGKDDIRLAHAMRI